MVGKVKEIIKRSIKSTMRAWGSRGQVGSKQYFTYGILDCLDNQHMTLERDLILDAAGIQKK